MICSGDDVTFTCVVDSGATSWTLTPGGRSQVCSYQSGLQVPDTCGPDEKFSSFRTPGSVDNKNSSLSVVSITEDVNQTLVECIDGVTSDLIGLTASVL